MSGYAPRQLEQVQVRLDRVTNVHVTLPQASFSESIEVTMTTPVVDPVQVSAGQTFTSDYITETSADWSNLITQTAGASNRTSVASWVRRLRTAVISSTAWTPPTGISDIRTPLP